MRIVSQKPMAMARLRGNKENPNLKGYVRLYQYPCGVLVEAEISGLPNRPGGFFGFHIHEGGACEGETFSGTGSHYDTSCRPHPRHAGDLPPLISYGGRAYMAVMTDRFSIRDVVGRTVVVHGMPDDFRSQPAGDAGEKIACGVICR